MNGFLSMYGFCLLLIGLLCWRVLGVGVRARGLRRGTRGLLFALCLALGVVFSRAFYVLTSPFGRLGALVSWMPYEYAMSGAVLGAILGGLLCALLTRQSAGYVLDAMTPAAMTAAALARCAEMFTDFGWGAVVEGEWARLPFAVPDMFEQWRLSVFFLSAALILLALVVAKVWRKRLPGELFSIALCWLAMGQIFCETMRSESICWGFVRVQQLACAVMALGLLVGWQIKNRLPLAHLRTGLLVFAASIGVSVFAQYAMDKLTHILPTAASYGLMAAALIVMGAAVQKTICAGRQDLLHASEK